MKKYSFEFFCLALAAIGIGGVMLGYVFSADFSKFASRGELALSEKEQALLSCFESDEKDCLTDIDTVTYGQTIWSLNNENTPVKGMPLTCYDDKEGYCDRYGAYYTFEEAKKVCQQKKMRLPSLQDFQYLYAVFHNDQDRFIFDMNLFPSGAIVWGESSVWLDKVARYWVQDLYDEKKPVYYGFSLGKTPVAGEVSEELLDSRFSVRCVKYTWER